MERSLPEQLPGERRVALAAAVHRDRRIVPRCLRERRRDQALMFDHDIRALSVAIAYDGAVLGKRGYTLSRDVLPEHRHAAARRRKQAE